MSAYLWPCDTDSQARGRGDPKTLIIGTLLKRRANKRMTLMLVEDP